MIICQICGRRSTLLAAVSENAVYAVNEAFFAFDLFTILPSLQVIHCVKNTVQENEIFTAIQINDIGILENRTANRRLDLNRRGRGWQRIFT